MRKVGLLSACTFLWLSYALGVFPATAAGLQYNVGCLQPTPNGQTCWIAELANKTFEGEEGNVCKTQADRRCFIVNVDVQWKMTRTGNGGVQQNATVQKSFSVICRESTPTVYENGRDVKSYSLDRKMLKPGFSVPNQSLIHHYDLWWAICKNETRKFSRASR